MARHKNMDWDLPGPKRPKIATWQQAEVALLMDIRDELKELNARFRCPNFLQIPAVLRSIRRGMPKRRRKVRGGKIQ